MRARAIYDSRGDPTLEVELRVSTFNHAFRAAAPSGASTGAKEAHELRDGGAAFGGKGVAKAIGKVLRVIGPAIVGRDVSDIRGLDARLRELDGTGNKSNLGANAILGVSMAACRAAAAVADEPLYAFLNRLAGSPAMVLPVPCFNCINGGAHAGNDLPFQEFLLLPVGAASFSEAMQLGSEAYHALKKILAERLGADSVGVGDEGGFAPKLASAGEAIELLLQAVDAAGHRGRIAIGVDAAASELFDKSRGLYRLGREERPGGAKSADELLAFWEATVAKYPQLVLLEDPFDEADLPSHAKLTARIGRAVEIVGDDLFCTNPAALREGLAARAANALLLKPNQVGTVSEALDAYALCVEGGWGVCVSHRSGETEDTFIADLAVGLGAGQIKAGAPCRSERLAKYNRLLRIEEELGPAVRYAGKDFRMSGRF